MKTLSTPTLGLLAVLSAFTTLYLVHRLVGRAAAVDAAYTGQWQVNHGLAREIEDLRGRTATGEAAQAAELELELDTAASNEVMRRTELAAAGGA